MTLPLPVAPALMAPAPGGQSSLAPFLLQLGLIVAIFYFLLIRPQQKQRRQHEQSLANLKKGDEIVTAGGIVGEVVHIKETLQDDGTTKATMDDRVTIKSGDTRVIVERGRISKITAAQGGAQG
ncbi:MAG TPA: preprotein translocase subunit YajC [Gemmatimonadaceae bacterium]|nr:preprotein translocase subunit YajC [Gemmatimonadaceae bacterium]